MIRTVTDWAVGLMDTLGGLGAAIVVGMDNLFPPIPSEIVLPLAGFSASRGSLTLAEALIWTTLGSVAGALIVYWVGAALGRERTRRLITRIPLIIESDMDRSEKWFARHGGKAVLFGRMIPLFRSFISLPAGVERMPLPKFVLYTALGSAIWNTIFVLAGYFLGENWHVVERYAGVLQWVVLAAAVVAVGWFVASRVARKKAQR
ncbi:membrane protein DedA with SNARE-associated domain [Kibdelosporangium banguiense]|uniref:Membrane protein DedA with SNARE-associated domain n=1 Tax=Kibdelosporangium banguiense TaxID=1365924 RepID=A0ABS4T706_9PSEU|nr:DedA family protein [Kibdelosporangium banguiense]MBP2320200.1 membrane protein DedA with SNARE-associated domain [Kibdelosporangium banguiense]